ncbi:5007_t:CDS:1 [Funneliformis caledonium]|uniref:5007_t:CDS:1 n=1 Tax=Funneliformis caledonium TaxID=1117310 RepID=A0A9N9GGW2_9GLOM|nr:5007_t:CDS:1 [Funneliformis caledonium]
MYKFENDVREEKDQKFTLIGRNYEIKTEWRKLYDDERNNSEPINNKGKTCLEGSCIYPTSPRFQSSPESFSPTHSQASEPKIPLEMRKKAKGKSSCQIDVSRIVNPIVKCISDLKSEFHTQFSKRHYDMDPNPYTAKPHTTKIGEEWQDPEYQNDEAVTAGRLLDVILTMKLPKEAKKRLVQARDIIWDKILHHRNTTTFENIIIQSSTPRAVYIDPVANADSSLGHTHFEIIRSHDNNGNNNKSSKEDGSLIPKNNQEKSNVKEQTSTVVTTDDKIIDDPAASIPYRRFTTQWEKPNQCLTCSDSTSNSSRHYQNNERNSAGNCFSSINCFQKRRTLPRRVTYGGIGHFINDRPTDNNNLLDGFSDEFEHVLSI